MPNSLRRLCLVASAAICATLAWSAAPADALAAGSGDPTARASERALLVEVNRVRARHGRGPLAGSPLLAGPARSHSRWLASTGTLTHDGPGGAPFWHRLVAAGFPRAARMAENLAQVGGCGTGVARRTVGMWMASPPHRANLLDPSLRRVGLGVARLGGCGATVVTAAFGS